MRNFILSVTMIATGFTLYMPHPIGYPQLHYTFHLKYLMAIDKACVLLAPKPQSPLVLFIQGMWSYCEHLPTSQTIFGY